MKKFWMMIIYAGFLSVNLSAQFNYGAYIGANGFGLHGDAPENFRYQKRPGFNVGAAISYRIKPDVRISFQPGYAQSYTALAYEDKASGELRDSVDLSLTYIKMPFLMDILSDNLRWHFMAGADFQLALEQMAKTGSEETDLSDEFLTINPVIYFGLGRRIPIGTPILYIDLRFGQGLLNITNSLNDETSLVPRTKTSVLELLVGIEFNSKD